MSQRNSNTSPNSSEHLSSMRILLINPPNSGRNIPGNEYGIDSTRMPEKEFQQHYADVLHASHRSAKLKSIKRKLL